jgi:hypothetical protein
MLMMRRDNLCCVQERIDNPIKRVVIIICLVLLQNPEKDTTKLYHSYFIGYKTCVYPQTAT